MADMDRNEYNGGMENMPETDGSKRPETGTDRQEDGWTSYESGQGSQEAGHGQESWQQAPDPFGQASGPKEQNSQGQYGAPGQNGPYDPYGQQNPGGYQNPGGGNMPGGQYGPYDPYGQNPGGPGQNAPYGQQNPGGYQNPGNGNMPGGQPRQQKPKNNFATGSLACGILGLLTLCCCAFPLAIILGVGAVSFAVISKKGQPFSGTAIAGIVLGIICILLGIGEFLYVLAFTSFMNDPENAAMFNEIYEQMEQQLQQMQ